MRISIFGLGYVGTVTAACISEMGHEVFGVDVKRAKVRAMKNGSSPINESCVDEMISRGVREGRIQATTNPKEAVMNSEMGIVCVGTPSNRDGSLDLRAVKNVTAEIGQALTKKEEHFLFVLRSTVLPGTVHSTVLPIIERTSGKIHGSSYSVVFHPEFLREGNAVEDFLNPPKIVIGEIEKGSGDKVSQLYTDIDAPVFRTSIKVAEGVKYADNAFHALKITFANEMGQLFKSLDVDSREVMDIFVADKKLNISPKYLRPGFAFGGSCLPKDLRALMAVSNSKDLKLPMLEGILPSNEHQINRVVKIIENEKPITIGLVGLSFKPGTDDLRESPLLKLATDLIDEGYKVEIFDPLVNSSSLVGSNKRYLEELLEDYDDVFYDSLNEMTGLDLIIIGHPLKRKDVSKLLSRNEMLLDLVGHVGFNDHPAYKGLFW